MRRGIVSGKFLSRFRVPMLNNIRFASVTLAVCAVVTGAQGQGLTETEIKSLRSQALEVFQPLPDKMPGADKDTKEQIKLGEALFFEKKLSVNNSQSCNSCHAVDNNRGGVDNETTSLGAFKQRGGRNSPTVLNAGFHIAQFWDGRAETLEHQAKGPVLNPVEMAMPNEKEVLKRLQEDKQYPVLFKKAFPADAQPISYDNVAKAIAAFERTLVTKDRFDDFLKGDHKALNASELRGLKLFMDTGCTTCHTGPLLGGNSYQKMGLVNKYDEKDSGRFEVTKLDDDKGKFKVPALRNIAITFPYFHDGQTKGLDEAVVKMAHHQLGMDLKKNDVEDIVAFLRALTDKPRAKALETASAK